MRRLVFTPSCVRMIDHCFRIVDYLPTLSSITRCTPLKTLSFWASHDQFLDHYFHWSGPGYYNHVIHHLQALRTTRSYRPIHKKSRSVEKGNWKIHIHCKSEHVFCVVILRIPVENLFAYELTWWHKMASIERLRDRVLKFRNNLHNRCVSPLST